MKMYKSNINFDLIEYIFGEPYPDLDYAFDYLYRKGIQANILFDLLHTLVDDVADLHNLGEVKWNRQDIIKTLSKLLDQYQS